MNDQTMQGKATSVHCDNCQKNFFLNQVNETEVKLDDQMFTLAYFYCPHCLAFYRVSLFDEEAKRLTSELEEMRNKISAFTKNHSGNKGQAILKHHSVKALGKQAELKRHLDALQKRFPGTFKLTSNDDGTATIHYLP